MKQAVQNFLRDEEGATAIEYGLIAGLIAVVLVASLTDVGAKLKSMFNYITNNIQNTSSSS